jgi:hypothetical protein
MGIFGVKPRSNALISTAPATATMALAAVAAADGSAPAAAGDGAAAPSAPFGGKVHAGAPDAVQPAVRATASRTINGRTCVLRIGAALDVKTY